MGPIDLDLCLSYTEVPMAVGLIKEDGVTHNVGITIGRSLHVIRCKAQLDGVNQFGRKHITLEVEADAFHFRICHRMVEILIEVKLQQTLHTSTHCHPESFITCLEGDTLAHLDKRHVLQLLHQLIRFADTDTTELLLLFLRKGCGSDTAEQAKGQQGLAPCMSSHIHH